MNTSASMSVASGEARWVRILRIVLGLTAIVALSPIAGMVVVFAFIPMLPIALAIGVVLGPMNFIEEKEEEAEIRFGHHRFLEVPA